MNELIASKLRDLGKLRQLQGANSFRSGAYFKAAKVIEELGTELEDADQLYAVDGIGSKVVAAVEEIIETGTLEELDEAESLLAPIRELTKVPGIGPKRAAKFVEDGIETLSELKVHFLNKGGNKRMLDAIAFAEMQSTGRIPREFVEEQAQAIRKKMLTCNFVQKAQLTGSLRRGRPTVKDVDLLVCSFYPEKVVAKFLEFGNEIESGDRKASIYVWSTIGNEMIRFRMDLMIVQEKSWGAALCHFTGSKEHNIKLRAIAKARGIKVSQNGITGPSGEWLGGEEEEDLYRVLKLDYVKPEDREEK